MIQDFSDGIISYARAFHVLGKFKLWPYLLINAIIGIGIAALAIFLTLSISADIGGWLDSLYRWEFGRKLFTSISSWIARALILATFFFTYKYLMIIVTAPVMSLLSEKVEKNLDHNYLEIRFSISRAIREMIRGLRLAIRNLIKELLITLILLVLSLFPLFAVITGPSILIVQSYYAGFGNIDFYLERHLNIRGSVEFIKKYKGLAIGNGAVYLGFLLIPFIGVIVGPTLATIAATLEGIKRRNSLRSEFVPNSPY